MWTDKEGCVPALPAAIILLFALYTLLQFSLQEPTLVWKSRGNSSPTFFFFPEVEVLMLSGPTEYVYLVLGEWWPQKQECAKVWLESSCYILIFNP